MTRRVLIPVLMSAALIGCGKKEIQTVQAVEAPPVRVGAVRVETRPFAATVAITGTLVSSSRVEVKAETTGKVVKFAKEEGDRVSAGEAVVWVDDSNEKIALRQTETAVLVAEAALERAKVMQVHSQSEFVRSQSLLKSGGITDRDYKTAELAGLDSRAAVALASAQLEQARAQLDHVKKMVADSVVRAPVAGEIQNKYAREGTYVEPPTQVFSLVDNTRLELESMVAAADLAPIRPGQKVSFAVNSFPGAAFEGRVIEVNPAVQTETRSAKVRIRVDNASGRLKSGMFVQGEILTGVSAEAIIVPAAAVYRDDRSSKTSFVYVVEKGKAARRNVRIGREHNSVLEIAEGLKAGDLVIAEQSIEVADGVRVEPQTAAAGGGK